MLSKIYLYIHGDLWVVLCFMTLVMPGVTLYSQMQFYNVSSYVPKVFKMIKTG